MKGQFRQLSKSYVIDFDGDLYDKEVAVEWIEHIRMEEKFDSVDALVEQMVKDKNSAKEMLAVHALIVAIQKWAWYYK